MNILYIPQLSMYDKKNGKFIPEADGNLNMMRNFINEWNKYRKDHFYILLPSEIWEWIDGIKANRTRLYYDSYVTSARINRFNFPIDEIKDKVMFYNFDLVICDIPELARNIKAMFSILFGYEPKIISNIRHVDDLLQDKSSYDYIFRLADGIDCSDECTILSESMADILMDDFDKYFQKCYVDSLYNKIHTFEPSISTKELDSHDVKFYVNEKKIITFPGRLSKGEESRTNWDKFALAIQELRKERQDFNVYFTDPNNSMRRDLELNYVYTIPNNRREFIQLLAKTDIIVSLMAIQGFGGISIRESLHFGCYPVIPYVSEYKKMAKDEHVGFIHGEITVDSIKKALNNALNNFDDFYPALKVKLSSIKKSKQFTIEYQMPKLLEKLGGILNG